MRAATVARSSAMGNNVLVDAAHTKFVLENMGPLASASR
jgi:hypothetical protein